MFWSDVIYVALLLFSVAIGPFYQRIENPIRRKWASTAIGLTLVTIVSGSFVLHPLIVTIVNAIIITKLPQKTCHMISLFFSFFYLLIIFRLGDVFGLSTPPTHTNLIQMMMTLKLPGLAFEINAAMKTPNTDLEGINSMALKSIGFLDVIHYAFSYMGVLTGPYYRYRTYWDSFYRPFAKYTDPWPLTFYKLKQAFAFAILFFVMNWLFPSKYVLSEEYAERSIIYKLSYIYPAFAVFRLRMFVGMLLSECVCQMSGLGAYPTICNSLPGLGPQNYKAVEALSNNPSKLKDEKYDFDTVYNMNIWEVETCLLVRTAMKVWNTTVQYWMATCVYKRFPYKNVRIIATLVLSALWHGYAAGYYFCICQIPLYLPLEDLCVKFYKNSKENSLSRRGWGFFLWFMRLSCMAYLGIPFLLLDLYEIIHFYKTLYFSGHIIALILYIIARSMKHYILAKHPESKDKNQ
ncbi:hypothetical protein KM043_011958 [Ampulex compressa]|nr:hypothetical protein KM043_011958 [Ampulex compressa]